jgi:acyl-CoA dehydrogenase
MELENSMVWLGLFVTSVICAYLRARLAIWLGWLVIVIVCGLLGSKAIFLPAAFIAFLALILGWPVFRRGALSRPLLRAYLRRLPRLSETERVALECGTVGFEGELFSGWPNWAHLLGLEAPRLTEREQDFLDGPVARVCALTDDWTITRNDADLPPAIWDILREERFFGLIIPQQYGGLGFSALLHHRVIAKLASRSTTLSSTVAVPNSLGPAELLLHYGTTAQKDEYLPRLANGLEIPCFALTSPSAGSDATSISDRGVVCEGLWQGQQVLGVRLDFEKRYITLAPVATLVGLAFRLYDPDGLLSANVDRGITLALVPRGTKGLSIGRRHLALDIPFHNGPISGKDVFVPLSQLIGGPDYIGRGWQMLVECLAVGRAITLPSSASGAARMAALATGAYARIRKQFGLAIGRFEGVEQVLARMGARVYAIDALAEAAAQAVDRGEKPTVVSAIAKYHCTEMGRMVAQDAMDVHGGKGIMLGPHNYLARSWQGAPIGITVEGANIMTRSLLIFGQGAVLCHPWVLSEMRAAQDPDPKKALKDFDRLAWKHAGFLATNIVRSCWMALTGGLLSAAPTSTSAGFYQKLNRYSAAMALLSDISMLTLGGRLKFKEALSGRLGDVLSQLYLVSCMLRRHSQRGHPEAELPWLNWACLDAFYAIEVAMYCAIRNFPVKAARWMLRAIIFPWGRRATPPGDRLSRRAAVALMTPGPAREELAVGLDMTPGPSNPAARICAALPYVVEWEPLERKWNKLCLEHGWSARDLQKTLAMALEAGLLNEGEASTLRSLAALVLDAIEVDDFGADELRRA